MAKTYIIESPTAESREATLRLYGIIGKKVDGDLFAQELASLDDAGLEQINIRGNCPGGDVYQRMSIVSAIVSMKTPVVFFVDGVVASMGAFIAVTADRIVMMDYSRLMFHDPFFAGANSDKLTLKQKKLLENCTAMLRKVMGRRGKSEQEVEELMKAESWFSAEEALAAGFCDEITASAKQELINMAPFQLVAAIEAEYEPTKTDMEKITLTAEAIVALGIQDTAPDAAAVSAAIVKMKAAADARVTAVEKKLQEHETAQQEARKKEADALISAAIQEGKTTADQKDTLVALFDKDFDGTKNFLASLPAKNKLGNLTGSAGGSARYADKSWDELDKAGLLAELKTNDPALYEAKYKEMAATLKVSK
ncbi:MAG: ATP-dependent Clp protease proteolytic subunit [Bacteroides sp.]|nr:ATP-dependent Clp protease proteolytic subunit [Bacteroides sp.]